MRKRLNFSAQQAAALLDRNEDAATSHVRLSWDQENKVLEAIARTKARVPPKTNALPSSDATSAEASTTARVTVSMIEALNTREAIERARPKPRAWARWRARGKDIVESDIEAQQNPALDSQLDLAWDIGVVGLGYSSEFAGDGRWL
jgi:hypothetical protein